MSEWKAASSAGADPAGSRGRLRLHVGISSPAMLRLLWSLQIAKGAMSVERAEAVSVDARVELVLVVAATEIVLAATVRSCVPHDGRFLVGVGLDPIGEAQRTKIGKLVAL